MRAKKSTLLEALIILTLVAISWLEPLKIYSHKQPQQRNENINLLLVLVIELALLNC
jgi:hypothetical protein